LAGAADGASLVGTADADSEGADPREVAEADGAAPTALAEGADPTGAAEADGAAPTALAEGADPREVAEADGAAPTGAAEADGAELAGTGAADVAGAGAAEEAKAASADHRPIPAAATRAVADTVMPRARRRLNRVISALAFRNIGAGTPGPVAEPAGFTAPERAAAVGG
jgi:hypothetical protein